MSTVKRLKELVIMVMIGAVCGAPLDEQQIYFPGENPDGEDGLARYQLLSNAQVQQMQQSHEHLTNSPGVHPRPYHHFGQVQQEKTAESMPQLTAHDAQQHQRTQEFSHAQFPFQAETSEGKLQSTTGNGQEMLQSQFKGNSLPAKFKEQKISEDGLSHDLSRQYVIHNSPTVYSEETIQNGNHHSTGFHPMPSVSHASPHASLDLASILDSSLQGNELHPSIQQAYRNVIKSYENSSSKAIARPMHQTIHKVSHVKTTKVQNIGNSPGVIQNTSTNDDINLSELIEQLHMLENSPRHINITWCEEKIKEFLQALRRKQASGVYINQQVQEETLHQILTHESVENDNGRDGVSEPLMVKVTRMPLGSAGKMEPKETSDLITTEIESHEGDVDMKNHQLLMNQTKGGEQLTDVSPQHPEIYTIVPPQDPNRVPMIMSHQYQSFHEVPPFTPEKGEELEIELPGYQKEIPETIPIKHTHQEEVESFDAPLRPPTAHSDMQPEHQESINVGGKSEETLHSSEFGQEGNFKADPNTPEGFQPRPLGDLDLNLPEYQDNNRQSENELPTKAEFETQESNRGQYNAGEETPQIENHEYLEDSAQTNHVVHGRPEAPEGVINLASNNEEQLVYVGNADHHRQQQQLSHLHRQQINYETLIEELIQLESLPGHQAIDKCEEKIQEFLEILKYQQEQGFGRNQHELERLHQTLIQQAQDRSKELQTQEEGMRGTTVTPVSFWRKVQKQIKTTYEDAKDRAKEVIG